MSELKQRKAVPGAGDLLQNTNLKKDEVAGIANDYVDFFDRSKHDEQSRRENYEKVVNSYYDLATDFYEYGWGQSFHFAPPFVGENYQQAIARHEHYLALKLKLNKDDTVLDCGCGVGGPAREIARFSQCRVVGINNNQYQVERATSHTIKAKLTERVTFVKGNFMDIPSPEGTFDGVYAIEATCHAPDKEGVYSQIFRVLKPGARFAAYEWCMTDKYDPENQEHRDIKLGIEEGDGIPDLATTAEVIRALKAVGFVVEEYADLAHESETPWYAPLEGNFSLSNFRQTKIGRWCTHKMVTLLETLKLAPAGTVKTHDFLIKAADNLVAGGRQDIFTPMWFFVARKPE